MTVPATIRFSAVLLPCPKCETPMNLFGGKAQCDNTDCEVFGKEFELKLPTFDVILTD